MKKMLTVFMLCSLTFGVHEAYAQNGFGIGLIVGEPTGISLKKWIGDRQAVDFAVAWSFSENESFQFHADYLIHNFSLIDLEEAEGRLPVYYGIGGRIKLRDEKDGRGRNDKESLVGLRIPFGISYLFAQAPVDLFVEVVPIMDLVPDTELDINGAIGARFYLR